MISFAKQGRAIVRCYINKAALDVKGGDAHLNLFWSNPILALARGTVPVVSSSSI